MFTQGNDPEQANDEWCEVEQQADHRGRQIGETKKLRALCKGIKNDPEQRQSSPLFPGERFDRGSISEIQQDKWHERKERQNIT